MRAGGFTLIELMIVLSCAAIMVPAVYRLARHAEDQSELGHWQLDVAEGIRTIAEELAADARRGPPIDEGVGFTFGVCDPRYAVHDAVLVRSSGCREDRGLSRFVESIAWTHGGVEVVFARRLRPRRVRRTTVFIPVEGR
jgi:prepilin-type N-terminal cleavage/methylation domain-containing protein